MPAELRKLIQKQDAVVRPRLLARPRHLAAADQAHVGNGVRWGAKGAGRLQSCAPSAQAGHATDPCGVDGLGQGHRRQDGGERAP